MDSNQVWKSDTQNGVAQDSEVKSSGISEISALTVYDGGITEEIAHGYLPTKLNFLFAQSWGSYPLKDGRYVYEEQFREGAKFHVKKKVYCGVPEDVLNYLTETDRKQNNQQRKDKDHADYRYIFEDNADNEPLEEYHYSVMDKAAYQEWFGKNVRDNEEDDPVYPDELLMRDFVPGENRVNNQRWMMRRSITEQFVAKLTAKPRNAVIGYYGMGMTEESIGKMEGIKKQAVSNLLNEEVKAPLREVFLGLGFDVPSEEKLKEEAEASRIREEARKQAERERRVEEREIRILQAIMRNEVSTETRSRTPITEDVFWNEDMIEDMENESYNESLLEEFDPDNPEDSVSDDYDPYEDPRYKEEEEEETDDYWDE